jgi:hypothetical protein
LGAELCERSLELIWCASKLLITCDDIFLLDKEILPTCQCITMDFVDFHESKVPTSKLPLVDAKQAHL